jgi:hypothetical protein
MPKTLSVHVPFSGAGGEGATAREVLRHRSVERLVMCDIDKVRSHLLRGRAGRQQGRQRLSMCHCLQVSLTRMAADHYVNMKQKHFLALFACW